jgi:hypothetical protein
MTDEEIFDLAETHGWQDDFGRWNFKDDGLIKFALAIQKPEWVELTEEEVFRLYERIECCSYSICAAEEKLKEKNSGIR